MNGTMRALAGTLLAAMALTGCQAKQGQATEVTSIERKIADSLRTDASGKVIESPYAENITFRDAKVRVNPEDDDELLIDLEVVNAGPKTVRKLHVWVDFYNRDGRKAADEGELLAHNLGVGDNSSPIKPNSSKRAIIELDSPEDWTGGKALITIDDLEVE